MKALPQNPTAAMPAAVMANWPAGKAIRMVWQMA
jgi:hypothetical protein